MHQVLLHKGAEANLLVNSSFFFSDRFPDMSFSIRVVSVFGYSGPGASVTGIHPVISIDHWPVVSQVDKARFLPAFSHAPWSMILSIAFKYTRAVEA